MCLKVKLPIITLSVIFILLSASLNATELYEINLNKDDFTVVNYDDYSRIIGKGTETIYENGEPELPMLGYKYYIPSNREVTGIKIINVIKQQIPGEFYVYPAQPITPDNQQTKFLPPDEAIYSSSQPFPGKAAEFGGTGFKKGHLIANVCIFPFEYIPARKTLYFYSSIEFEFVYGDVRSEPSTRYTDMRTIEDIKSLVENDSEVEQTANSISAPAKISQSMVIDSVPCVIITNVQMQPVFENYAWWKTKMGTRTEVWRVDVIELMYSCDSADNANGYCTQGKIRNFIKDYSSSMYTEYFILAGDVDIIPAIHVDSRDEKVLSDLYYSNLDGNWNDDGDTLFGECSWDGDTVDYYSEVIVGRIPCTTADEAQIVVDKIMAYQTDTTLTDYQTEAMFISSNLMHDGDGQRYGQKLIDMLPSCFNDTVFYNCDTATVLDGIESGPGLIVNYSHASFSNTFITMSILSWGPGSWPRIFATQLDPLNTNGRYSVFLNSTCNNNKLDATDYEVVSEHFMLCENGCGVAYIGSTNLEYSLWYKEMHQYLFGVLFDSNYTRLGPALTMAKEHLWVPESSHIDDPERFGLFSYMYLGDPQMEIWSDEPKILEYDFIYPDTFNADEVEDTILVRVKEKDGGFVGGALVCLTKGYDGTYAIEYTSPTGLARFTNISFSSTGDAYLVASKSNYFPVEDTIPVVSGGSGCPMLYVHNGTDYQLVNNILAQSEDISLSLVNNADFYPIYSAPLLDDNTVKLRIAEDEKERSYIDQIGFSYIYYPVNQRVVYTNKNEFRLLSSDSLLPVSAVDNSGVNILEQISSFDNNSYTADQPGYLIIKYQMPAGLPKPTDEGGGGIEPPPGGKHNPKPFADVPALERNKNVMIYVLDAAGDWQKLNTLYPRLFGSAGFTDLENMFIGDEITVKIKWNNSIEIDCLPYHFFDGPAIAQQTMIPSAAVHSDVGDIATEILTADYNEITLSPDEYIDLEFGSIPYQENHRIAVAFKSYGRYENIDDAEGLGGFTFDQNSPNPFNAATTFSFGLPKEVHVSLTVYNILGQKVIELVDELLPAGSHRLTWNGIDAHGNETASGMYFARFTAGDYSVSRKMMIVK